MTTTTAFPASTEYLGYLFRNLGPLTTTFTAPASCQTVNTDEVLFAWESRQPWPAAGNPVCLDNYWRKGDCIPSGKDIDDRGKALETAKPSAKYQGEYYYHSPGIVCPSGWETVGLIAKDNGTVSMSGYFTQWSSEKWGEKVTLDETFINYLAPTLLWGEFLKPSQTVAFCGPTGYDILPNGWAYSTLGPYSDYDYTGWCTEEWAGSPMKQPKTVYSVSNTNIPAHLSYVHPESWGWKQSTYTPSDDKIVPGFEELNVVTRQEVLAMIYEATDLENAATNTATATGSEITGSEAEETGGASTVGESSATNLSVRTLVPVLTVLAGMFVGSAMF